MLRAAGDTGGRRHRGLRGAGGLGLGLGLVLAGCAPDRAPGPEPRAVETARLPEGATAAPGTSRPGPPRDARTVAQFDTASPAERAAAASAPDGTGGAALGRTIASLGNPALPGFWAETPLVAAVRPGRLTDPATGRGVAVELRPSGGAAGAGTRVSLSALRVLGVPLTALPELVVTGL